MRQTIERSDLGSAPALANSELFAGNFTAADTREMPTIQTDRGPLKSGTADSVGAVFLGGTPDWSKTGQIQLIFVEQLVPHPWNPRQWVDRRDMLNTAASVSSGGIHTPLDICQYEGDASKGLMLSGHRRLWVASSLGIGLVPCRLDPRGLLTELQQRESLIKANEGQEVPAPIDRAKSIVAYMACATPPLNQSQVARKLNISPVEVGKLLRYLTLPEPVQLLINAGSLNRAVADQLAKSHSNKNSDPERIIAIATEAVERKWSARRALAALTGIEERRSGVRIESRRSSPENQPSHSTASVSIKSFQLAGDLSITVTSNRIYVTDEVAKSAVREAVMQIPVRFGSDPTYRSNGSHHTGSSPTSLAHVTEGESEQRTAPSADLISDPYGLKAPITYKFPLIKVGDKNLRSAAAQSIDAIFINGLPDWSKCDQVQLIFSTALRPHPWNPRVALTPEGLREMVLSVKATGIHNPLVITKHKENPHLAYIVGGHRRTWVSLNLGLELIPCRLDPRGVLSEIQVRESLLADNEGQVKTAPIDRAHSYHDYLTALRATGIHSVDSAAANIGVNAAALRRALRLLELPAPVQQMLNSGALNETQGAALCDHRGGEQAVIALATKAVAEGLNATILRSMAKTSTPNLTAISGNVSENNELHFAVGAGRRVHVRISAKGSLPDGDNLVKMIASSLESSSKPPSSAETPAALIVTEQKPLEVFKLKDIVTTATTNDAARVVKYLGSLVTLIDEEHVITADVKEALTRPFSNAQLKKMGLAQSEFTQLFAAEWHKFNQIQSSHQTVSIGQLMSYWIGSLGNIAKLPQSKKYLDANLIRSIPLDTSLHRGGPREAIANEIRSHLSGVQEVLSIKVLPIIRAEIASRQWRESAQGESEINSASLHAGGFDLSPRFKNEFNRWRREHSLSVLPTQGEVTYRFGDVHQFMVAAVSSTMELSGMNLKGLIGRNQLREHFIPYSKVDSTSEERFSSRAIFDELSRQIEILNRLAPQSNA